MLLLGKFYKSQVVMRGIENARAREILQIESGYCEE